jgi:HPt (histidine-containing phosphotransfer) domain-containing protein
MMTSLTLTLPDFDWQQLKQLAGEDAAFETELLAIFLSDAQCSIQALDQAIAEQDLLSIEDIAHALRGSSANVGASSIASAARALEQSARNGQLNEAHALCQRIQSYCYKIQAYLHSKG